MLINKSSRPLRPSLAVVPSNASLGTWKGSRIEFYRFMSWILQGFASELRGLKIRKMSWEIFPHDKT